jgi:DivIVA domain-containing protein
MDLTPQSLHSVEFREARRGGYNTRDVDDFIERVAAGAGHLNDRVREAQMRAEAAESRLTDLQREVEELRRRPAAPEVSETDETLRRTLVLAQRTADATIKEAKEEANRVLSEAREEAARTRAEAEAEARRGADSARVNAQAEVEALLSSRDKLKVDLDALTRRIDDQRNQLRSGINEMQRLLDDPNALKPLPPVTLSEVERPAPLPVDQPADDQNGNGHHAGEVDDATAHVASLQEAPAGPPDLGPPTQPVPFAIAGDANRPWLPSELQGQGDEPLGPPPAPAGPNGMPPAPPDPSSRPSEWGRAVFEPDAENGDHSRFGRRR